MSPRVSDAGPRLRSRRRRSVLTVVLRVTIVVVVLAAVGAATWVVGFSSVLAAREVRVSGADVVSAEDVREAAAVPLGTPLVRLDLDAIHDRVAALAPVAEVRVERAWPDAVTVTVTERAPLFAVRQDDGDRLVLVDAGGTAYLEVAEAPAGMIVAEVPDRAVLPEVASALAQMPTALLDQVDTVSARTVDSIELSLDGGRTLVWGNAELSAQKAAVATVLLEQPGKRYDVSAPDRPAVR